MTSPIEDITVECPKCWHLYQDWFRGSVNLDLDDFDEEYLDQGIVKLAKRGRDDLGTAQCPSLFSRHTSPHSKPGTTAF